MILEKIVAATAGRVAALKETTSLEDLKSQVHPPEKPFAFEKALARRRDAGAMAFICEVKKASPSKGVIAAEFPYLEIARDYQAAGADAISVLTEPDFFQGANAFLTEIKQQVSIPVLRKDFIIDPIQIVEAHQIGADAILLICAILTTEQLREYLALADELGLSALVEAHDEAEVKQALAAGARVIGVNNRNLKTFEVDLNNSIRLRQLVPPEILFVSESGIQTPEDIEKLRGNGTNAVLIGETLMRSGDKKAALDQLRG
ncbi:indole-3-glycerol phosphate synthase TrpC [Acetobacterium wieringae]|uniref:indole-3-glycerol phosphate synthase TrpC n=1 Tax=Acetobacterium wieringae TaxID=52694 RepID=UPI0026ED53CF|nr:indole-3-glycerol phosphate synthase TrpC [Acetobacterium wieringae]